MKMGIRAQISVHDQVDSGGLSILAVYLKLTFLIFGQPMNPSTIVSNNETIRLFIYFGKIPHFKALVEKYKPLERNLQIFYT